MISLHFTIYLIWGIFLLVCLFCALWQKALNWAHQPSEDEDNETH